MSKTATKIPVKTNSSLLLETILSKITSGICTSAKKKELILDLYQVPISDETIAKWIEAFQYGEFPVILRENEIINFIGSLDPIEDSPLIERLKSNLTDHLPLKIIKVIGFKYQELVEFQNLE